MLCNAWNEASRIGESTMRDGLYVPGTTWVFVCEVAYRRVFSTACSRHVAHNVLIPVRFLSGFGFDVVRLNVNAVVGISSSSSLASVTTADQPAHQIILFQRTHIRVLVFVESLVQAFAKNNRRWMFISSPVLSQNRSKVFEQFLVQLIRHDESHVEAWPKLQILEEFFDGLNRHQNSLLPNL